MTLHVICGGDFMSQPYVAGALEALGRHFDSLALTATSMGTFTAAAAALRPDLLPDLWSFELLTRPSADLLSTYNELIVGYVSGVCRAALSAGGARVGVERLRFARTQMFHGSPVLGWAIYHQRGAEPGASGSMAEWRPAALGPGALDEILTEAALAARVPFDFRSGSRLAAGTDLGPADVYVDPTAETWITGCGYDGSPFPFGDALVTAATTLPVGPCRRVAPRICLPFGATLFGRLVAFIRPELRRFDHALGRHDAEAAVGYATGPPLPDLPEGLYHGLSKGEADRIRAWLAAVVLPTATALFFTQQPSWFYQRLRGLFVAVAGTGVAGYLEAGMNHEIAQRRVVLSAVRS